MTEAEIDSETDLVLFPRLGSQLEVAESIAQDTPSLIVCWIGNNDALSAAISFDELNASQLTPVDEFKADFMEIASRLNATGQPVVFGNIPDVTSIAFLMDREDLSFFLGDDYGLPEGHYTTLVAMMLIRLGLDDGSILQDPDFVLDTEEVETIKERIDTFNGIIETTAAGFGFPVVDINALFRDLIDNPPEFYGIPLTSRLLGDFFSLDGVHPSGIGHLVIANAFIETVNAHYQLDIFPYDENAFNLFFLIDPHVDKDGDGRVRGRRRAGLLETVAPFLGISGDPDDFNFLESIPQSADERRIAPGERWSKTRRSRIQDAADWTRRDAVDAFKRIYRFNKVGD